MSSWPKIADGRGELKGGGVEGGWSPGLASKNVMNVEGVVDEDTADYEGKQTTKDKQKKAQQTIKERSHRKNQQTFKGDVNTEGLVDIAGEIKPEFCHAFPQPGEREQGVWISIA